MIFRCHKPLIASAVKIFEGQCFLGEWHGCQIFAQAAPLETQGKLMGGERVQTHAKTHAKDTHTIHIKPYENQTGMTGLLDLAAHLFEKTVEQKSM